MSEETKENMPDGEVTWDMIDEAVERLKEAAERSRAMKLYGKLK